MESDLRAQNARLPAYTGYIQIEAVRCAKLRRTVALPAISPDDAAFWPTRPRRQTINEVIREELTALRRLRSWAGMRKYRSFLGGPARRE
jgi:hypothetical protein